MSNSVRAAWNPTKAKVSHSSTTRTFLVKPLMWSPGSNTVLGYSFPQPGVTRPTCFLNSLSIQRLRTLQEKKEAQAKSARRDIATLLERGKLETARVKVENS